MFRARPKRARRSRYQVSYRLTRSVPAALAAVLLIAVIVGVTLTYKRFDDFVSATTGHHLNPIGEVVQVVEPAQGTLAYKLKHGQPVNILLLGMGGEQNDAPYLTDSIMAVSIDPSSNLDDYEYPNYNNGYIRGGIHYKAGCQHLNGEQALQVARSRHAVQPQQSSDFGRAHRQQDIMQAIKQKATTVNGFAKAPQLLDALQKNIHTDMSLSDMKAIYDWGKNLPDSSIIRTALTGPSGAADGNLLDSYNCGMGPNVSQLCADDQSYNMIHDHLDSVCIDPKTLGEKAPVQIANGTTSFAGLDRRVTSMLDPTGLQLADPVGAHRVSTSTLVLDYSGGQFPLTTKWLQTYFGATVVAATPANSPPAAGQQTYGLVAALGHDYALRFLGE